MKETKTQPIIAIADLKVDGVYFDAKNELCQIKDIDNSKKQVKLLKMSQQMTIYLDFKRCFLVRRIR